MIGAGRLEAPSPVGLPGESAHGGAETSGADPLRHVVFLGASTTSATSTAVARPTVTWAPSALPAPASQAAPLDGPLADFYARLFAHSNLRVDRYRETVLRRREGACLRAVGARDMASASAALVRDPAAAERALQAVAIGVTSFFRDPAVFESLAAPLVQLSETRPAGLRILSVGCSDGRELYSIAMLLGALGVRSAALHGVDCRAQAIREAAAGTYTAGQVQDVPDAIRAAHFTPVAGRTPGLLQVRTELRDRCRWFVDDAFAFVANGGYDVVLCRNLLIYFAPDAAAELWRRLRDALVPDGLLVVGKAERPDASLHLRRVAACVYRMREPIA